MHTDVPPPASGHLGRRSWRRRAVVALYAGYPACIASLWLGSQLRRTGAPMLALIMVLPLVVAVAAMLTGGYILLTRTSINLPNIPDRDLDERQRMVRDRAYRAAFRIVGGVLLVAALYLFMALSAGWPLPRTGDAGQAIFWAVFIVTSTLPTAIVAWIEPDPEDDG